MSSIVIDTHVAVWYTFEPSKMSATALATLREAKRQGNSIYVPSVALVELVYLVEKNRIPENILNTLDDILSRPDSDLSLAPLDLEIARATKQVSRSEVPDFPDRIVAATALAMGLPLVSRDGKIRLSQVTTIW